MPSMLQSDREEFLSICIVLGSVHLSTQGFISMEAAVNFSLALHHLISSTEYIQVCPTLSQYDVLALSAVGELFGALGHYCCSSHEGLLMSAYTSDCSGGIFTPLRP